MPRGTVLRSETRSDRTVAIPVSYHSSGAAPCSFFGGRDSGPCRQKYCLLPDEAIGVCRKYRTIYTKHFASDGDRLSHDAGGDLRRNRQRKLVILRGI